MGAEGTGANSQQVAEAALVVSQLFLSVPEEPLRAALQDDAALRQWPLQDLSSARGTAKLREAITGESLDSQEALERDYLYLFTGIGRPLAQPYESPYVSQDGLLFDEPTMQVRQFYSEHGFRVPDASRPDDHIGYEFAFIAQLLAGADSEYPRAEQIAQRFCAEHLGQFAPEVFSALRAHAQTVVYQALADLAEGVLAHVHPTE